MRDGAWQELRMIFSGLQGTWFIGVEFLGSGIVNSVKCPGSVPYYSEEVGSNYAYLYFRVWDARKAGEWTSSVPIRLYTKTYYPGGFSAGLTIGTRTAGSGVCANFSPGIQFAYLGSVTNCSQLDLRRTVNVFDDGTFS